MKTSPKYTRLAHRRAVVRHLQQVLKDRHIEMDSSRKEPILCEDVVYADRVVSQDALIEVLDALEQLEATESLAMSEFEIKEKGIPPLRLPPPPKDTHAEDQVKVEHQSVATSQEAPQGNNPEDRTTNPGQPAGGGGVQSGS